MSPKEIATLFRVVLDIFKPIVGQPSDMDIARIVEAISPILLVVPFDKFKRKKNLIGLVVSNTKTTPSTAKTSWF